MICPHFTPAQLAQFAPVPCPMCDGWVADDGQVVAPQAALDRWPQFAQQIGPTVVPAVTRGHAAWEAFELAGRLAWQIVVILIVGGLLAMLVAFIVIVAT